MGKRGGQRIGSSRNNQRSQRADYQEIPKANAQFEHYYNSLGIVEDAERKAFWEALRRELPSSFRFTGCKERAIPVRQRLKDFYIPKIISIEHDGEFVKPPTAISWYPDQLAWQMTTPKNIVRRFPPFASFQKFLVSETSVGNISRQEAVSMIPPLLMDVRPGMTVLDLCAAPGSKAAQLIEMIHQGEEERIRQMLTRVKRDRTRELTPINDIAEGEPKSENQSGNWSDDGRTTGLLIANDADYKRAHLLIHQMKRLNSPNLIVTNHDATLFPSIKLASATIPNGNRTKNKYLKFDRILSDVPCSGDGTCRKNISVWKDWVPGNALGLHSTQVRILVRALQLLKSGGRVVYSTCSMNPVENEAVIASAIERCGGMSKVNLVDCSNSLPDLKRRPGLSEWKVMDKQGKLWQSWSEVEEEQHRKGTDVLEKLVKGMFPPAGFTNSIPLERCMRIYPHLQDTGAFFIAVLEKQSEIKAVSLPEGPKPDPSSSILATVAEIEAKPINTANPIPKIEALDSVITDHINGDVEGFSAAARQNKEVAPTFDTTPQKRALNAEADSAMATKRLRTREEVDDPAVEGSEDRQVHYPPPPGAILDNPSPPLASPIFTGHSQSLAPSLSPHNHLSAQPKKNHSQPFEEPFKYLSPDNEELRSISKFYGLSQRFPLSRFMVRNITGIPVKTIYYTSALARDILVANEGSGIKFVYCGVKMFVKQDVQKAETCKWRIQTDGLPLLEGWVEEQRVVKLKSKRTLRILLVEMFPKVDDGGWKALGEIGERVRDLTTGCCILKVEQSAEDDGFSESMVLPLWRSLHSVNLMLPKEDRKAMLLRLYNEDMPLLDHSKARFSASANGTTDTPVHPTTAEIAHHAAAPTASTGDVTPDRELRNGTGNLPTSEADHESGGDSSRDKARGELQGGMGIGQGEGIMELGGGD